MLSTIAALLLVVTSRAFALYPAQAPGVKNPLGKGADPAPVRWFNSTLGKNVYLFPDINFGSLVYLRVSDNLNTVQYDEANKQTVFQFQNNIATEAPDLSQTPDGRWVMYISAVSINTIYVIKSDTKDPLGKWTQYSNVQHGGTDIVGYDAHALNLPNGDRYLVWSTSYHAPPSISIIKLATINQAVPGTPLSRIIVPDQPYEMLSFPSGNFSYLARKTCGVQSTNAPVLEAPASWVIKDTVNLGYSANSYNNPTYTTLVATASTKSNLLDPNSWTKSPQNPILYSDYYSSTYGPGSGGFFTGPDDDVWFAYGAFSNATGFVGAPDIRTIRAQKMGYNAKGEIIRTVPINATRPIKGSCDN